MDPSLAITQPDPIKFCPPEQQVQLLYRYNDLRGWRIPDRAFEIASQMIPICPEGNLVAATLVPYLPKLWRSGIRLSGLERTFQELGTIAAVPFPHWLGRLRWCWATNRLRLAQDIVHPAFGREVGVLRWEVIDFGCPYNPSLQHSPSLIPHAGILAAAAIHRDWVMSNVKGVWLPGYELRMDYWTHKPQLSCTPISKRLRLNYVEFKEDSPSAFPRFVRPPIEIPLAA